MHSRGAGVGGSDSGRCGSQVKLHQVNLCRAHWRDDLRACSGLGTERGRGGRCGRRRLEKRGKPTSMVFCGAAPRDLVYSDCNMVQWRDDSQPQSLRAYSAQATERVVGEGGGEG